jgi:peptide/nickel transport system substrate-binding protein
LPTAEMPGAFKKGNPLVEAAKLKVGGDVEVIFLNFTDPNTEVDGEQSSIKTKHPLFSDPTVRKALSMLVDRDAIEKNIYGRAGRTTANFFNGLPQFVSKNTSWEFNIEKAAKLLDEAGWKPGADGIREKDGKKLKLLFQTSINSPRQKTQAIVKHACQKAGIDVELKSIVGSVQRGAWRKGKGSRVDGCMRLAFNSQFLPLWLG